MAGYGAVLSGAEREIRSLAEGLGAPVATSYVAKGILPEDHSLSLGNVGWLGHPVAHEMLREYADVVLAVGFSFSDLSTCWWTEGMPFVGENRLIQIDVEPSQIGRNYPIEVGLLGDGRAVLRDLLAASAETEWRGARQDTLELVKRLKAGFEVEVPAGPAGAEGMQPMRVVKELEKALPRDLLLSLDTGDHNHYFGAFFPIHATRRLLCPGGWTPMGFGPTAIISGKLANPDLPAVSVTGDGGFLMVCQEVATAVEWGVPVVWVVFNNQALGAIREGQKGAYDGRVIGTELNVATDYSALAQSLGAKGRQVTDYDQIGDAIGWALECGEPCVLDLSIARDPIPPPIAGRWFEPHRDEIPARSRGTPKLIRDVARPARTPVYGTRTRGVDRA